TGFWFSLTGGLSFAQPNKRGPVLRTERSAIMATRTKSTSLRRRFAWTIGSATAIAVVSLVSIIIYRAQTPPALNEPPALLADVDPPHEVEPRVPQTATPPTPQVVQASPTEEIKPPDIPANALHIDPPLVSAFVEQTPGASPAGNFHSQRYGYAVSLAGT